MSDPYYYTADPDIPQSSWVMIGLWGAFCLQLRGGVLYLLPPYNSLSALAPADAATSVGNNIIMNSPLTSSPSLGLPWNWQADLLTAIPSLMENMSLSLPSGMLANPTALSTSSTSCRVTALHFVYDSTRLSSIYAAATTVAALCLALGFFALRRNSVDETMHFSRILGGIAEFRGSEGGIKSYLARELRVQNGDKYVYDVQKTN